MCCVHEILYNVEICDDIMCGMYMKFGDDLYQHTPHLDKTEFSDGSEI